ATYFNGGLRAYDTSNPYQPQEVGYFVPAASERAPTGAIQINDVFVADPPAVYTVDRHVGGLSTVETDFGGRGGSPLGRRRSASFWPAREADAGAAPAGDRGHRLSRRG